MTGSPLAGEAEGGRLAILGSVDPLGGLRSARRRMTDPVDSLAQAVAERVTGLLVNALDVNALLQRVAVNDVLGRVDLNGLLERVDVNQLLERVDVNQLLERVDLDRLVAKVDVAEVADRVDVNAIAARIDINSLAQQSDLGAVIAKSSSSVASDALDVVRSQAVSLDELIGRWGGRLRRRSRPELPGPPELLTPAGR